MVLLGGAGTVLGPVYGAFLFLLIEEMVWRNLLQFHAGLLGIIVVCLVLFLPHGLGGGGRQFRRRRIGGVAPRTPCAGSPTCPAASAGSSRATTFRSDGPPGACVVSLLPTGP